MYYTNTSVGSNITGSASSNGIAILNTSTASISLSSLSINASNGYLSISQPQRNRTYYVNGHEVEVDSVYNDETYYGMIFSMISLFGYKGYETIKLNGFSFDKKVEDRLKTIFREEKIDSVIDRGGIQ